jgi:ribose/xylose/arabinose/galactoside ABC-type transport system permease subunit
MDTVTLVLTAADQFWIALYVATVLVTLGINLTQRANMSFLTVVMLTFLNCFVPIAMGISTGMWWFVVVGMVYLLVLFIMIMKAYRKAYLDASE